MSHHGKKTASFGYREVPEEEKIDYVVRHFNTVAKRYDFMNTLLSFGIHYLWKRTAIRELNLRRGDRVIDVCGGTGDLAVLAAKAVGPKGRVILYDLNRMMIERGRHKGSASFFRRAIDYVQGDAERITFADHSFDATMVGFGIRNLTHMEGGFKEMYRVLKPGGRIMCLEFSRPTAPLFRWLYDVYSFSVMPLLGQILVGSRQAYTYLPESIRVFPSPDRLTEILEELGFVDVVQRKLTNGIAMIHVGVKQEL
jgi:demethylmenaquinone methyltransferase/2-methoxy-6-polyprenyl-1,4-benzoquinol methylase